MQKEADQKKAAKKVRKGILKTNNALADDEKPPRRRAEQRRPGFARRLSSLDTTRRTQDSPR